MKIFAVILALMMAFGVAILVMGHFFLGIASPNTGNRDRPTMVRIIPRDLSEGVAVARTTPENIAHPEPVVFAEVGHSSSFAVMGLFAVVLFSVLVAGIILLLRKGMASRGQSATGQSQRNAVLLQELYELQEKMTARVESLETILTLKK